MPLSLIVLLPLLGFVINGLIGANLPRPIPGVIACLAIGGAFFVAVARFLGMAALPDNGRVIEHVYTWMSVGNFRADVSFLLDHLSGVMILIVTGIGLLIHIYSIGYMHHDHNDEQGKLYARYFAFLNLFVAFMSVLVLADNFLLMFVGWEGVGLCSYFLIGFWFNRQDASEASGKAFVVNRIGDFGFLLAMMLIFLATGTLSYFGDGTRTGVFDIAAQNPAAFSLGTVGALGGITLITLLLTLGATGKSAQIPLYTWLPDAMAGPTPVSALIHAATMVTAGVYMAARASSLFEAAPTTKLIICAIGALTALAAGATALAHTDIKKVLAYSTVSQLGFMFMAVGSGAYVAAIFHVFTHAFFKACLFLGAGSVIHALHGEQDMRKMGGLRAKMPITHLTFLVSGLALAGAAPFAGFFSKDEIIAATYAAGESNSIYIIFAVVGLLTALITAIYTGRQYAQVFGGAPRDEHLSEHAHESPGVMTLPLIILAIGAVFAGFLGVPHLPGVPESLHAFTNFLSPAVAGEAKEQAPNLALLGLGALIGWGGWIIGTRLGTLNPGRAQVSGAAQKLSLDALYNLTVVRVGLALSLFLKWVDERIVDGMVNGVGLIIGQISSALRLTQTSFVRNYAMAMAIGAAVVIAYFVVR